MFVVVEGPNGAGKTTLINNLKDKGYATLSSPNGTPLAQMLRPACRGTEPWEDIDKRIQFMLFSAARLDEYIRLVHNHTEVVIADRWWTSTYVYQCQLQGIPEEFLRHTIHPEEKIHIVLILGGDPEVCIQRVIDERAKNPEHGVCTWTKEKETMLKLAKIYDSDLPAYLHQRDVPWVKIDTARMTPTEVLFHAENAIKSHAPVFGDKK